MLKLKLINGASAPKYQTKGASGFDLSAVTIDAVYNGVRTVDEPRLKDIQRKFQANFNINLRPGERITFGTGIMVADMKPGYELQIRSRSSLAAKKGLFVSNQPGTVDSDYRGEIKISIFNSTKYLNSIEKGSRIAQAVLQKVEITDIEFVEEVGETVRSDGGFGSTGK